VKGARPIFLEGLDKKVPSWRIDEEVL